MGRSSPDIVIAGAGIGGLTAALCLSRLGHSVLIAERAPELAEIGAGLQLSPNATRILETLGVLAPLAPFAVTPEGVEMKRASTLEALARLPLGDAALERWGAPYLVVHRADLQRVLADCARAQPGIDLLTGTVIAGADLSGGGGVAVTLEHEGARETLDCRLLIGADGVWSTLRGSVRPDSESRFANYIAWRATSAVSGLEEAGLADVVRRDAVTALLDPRFHLVAYPVRAGGAINLVAVTPGGMLERGWSNAIDTALLMTATTSAHPGLKRFLSGQDWTAWPVFTVGEGRWTHPGGCALLGDAAHAMTPFAAQGAAMAIEDAAVLANALAETHGDVPAALAVYETARRARVARVARRAAFNRFVWHASGPAALGRDMVMRLRGSDSLMRDFDWLYGWRAETQTPTRRGGQ